MFIGITFIDAEASGISSGKDVEQPRALSFAQDYIDIYACAWGPDDQSGVKVGYNLAPEAIANGTKNVSIVIQLTCNSNSDILLLLLF